MTRLPVIDISPYIDQSSTLARKRSTALEIDHACREIGYFYIASHGIPQETQRKMLESTKAFFEMTTDEEKCKIGVKSCDDGGDGVRGYRNIKSGRNGAHEVVDFFRPVEESTSGPPYQIAKGENAWPSTPVYFREAAEEYTKEMLKLGERILKAIAMALDVKEEMLVSKTENSFWNLRILRYDGTTPEQKKTSGIGEHTDFGLLTFLLTDGQKGSLQIMSKQGDWVAADPVPGGILCIIGQMMAILTRDQYPATRHRVVHKSTYQRYSVPFFFDPSWDASIRPLVPAIEGTRTDEETCEVSYQAKFLSVANS